jgi:hypothetical protein
MTLPELIAEAWATDRDLYEVLVEHGLAPIPPRGWQFGPGPDALRIPVALFANLHDHLDYYGITEIGD